MQQPAHKEKPAKTTVAHGHALANAGPRDLRSTLEWLRLEGDLIETEKPVDPDLEVTGLQKHMDGGCHVMFHTVKGNRGNPVTTTLFGAIKFTNRMFG